MLLFNYLDTLPKLILSSQVVSLPCKSVIQVANFCAAMDTLIDQDAKTEIKYV